MTPSAEADIAIVGMSGLFPKAPDIASFWENILAKVDATTEAQSELWDLIYDPTVTANDRVYTRRGGFLGELTRFNPLKHAVLPRSIDGGEPEHFIGLDIAHEALADAGYLDREFDRERAAVILARGTYWNRGAGTAFQYAAIDQTIGLLATLHPEYTPAELGKIKEELRKSLPPFDADTAPGLVPSIMCGRIANRLNLMGPAYTVDAACAGSLVAIGHAIDDLRSGKVDMALAGGVHVSLTHPIMLVFCHLNALSRTGAARSFGPDADGTVLGEGAGILVLKRREDAERDGDRIYALLKGVGVASDGKALGILTPRVEGEVLAMRRAYEQTAVDPRTVSLVDGHGTGTLVGDATELEALCQVFGADRTGNDIGNPGGEQAGPWCGLGSIKSMIGHPIPAAGVAGVIKMALALHHKVIPPTLHVEDGNPKLESSPFYLSSRTRPWVHGGDEPRRAAVSAFGFGGINAHAILEEHSDVVSSESAPHPHLHRRFDAEAVVLSAGSRHELISSCDELRRVLAEKPDLELVDVAYTVSCPEPDPPQPEGTTGAGGAPPARLGIVATSIADLDAKLAHAAKRLADPDCDRIEERSGVYFTDAPLHAPGAVAFLFPGMGAQYENMLDDLCIHFPSARSWFDLMDRAFQRSGRAYLPSQGIFPPPHAGLPVDPAALWGVEAVFTANQALYSLLDELEIRADAVLGHSTGDFSSLWAAGAVQVDQAELIEYVLVLNDVYERLRAEGRIPTGALVAVGAGDREQIAGIVRRSEGALDVVMDNCPQQVVLGGTSEAVAVATRELQEAGALCAKLPFDRLYHTARYGVYSERLQEMSAQLRAQSEGRFELRPPQVPMYSCVTGERVPEEPAAVAELVTDQWSHPVQFRETVEAMYRDGARIFVEVGPRGSLSAFVDDTLRGQPHLAVPANVVDRTGVTQLAHLVTRLAAQHVPMNLESWYAHRAPRRLRTPDGWVSPPDPDQGSIRVNVELPVMHIERPPGQAASGVRDPIPAGGQASRPAAAGGVPALHPAATPQRTPAMPEHTRQPAAAPGGSREHAMESYLRTMNQFLDLQRRATVGDWSAAGDHPRTAAPNPMTAPTDAGRNGASGGDGPPSPQQPQLSQFPLLGSVVSWTEGQELVTLRPMDITEDVFLRDHTFGGQVSVTDGSLSGLPVVPLTVSMEMLAEVAAALCPGHVVVGMRNVRVYQWIALDQGQATLRPAARRTSGENEVTVELERHNEDPISGRQTWTRVMEAIVCVAEAYPQAPVADASFPLRSDRPYEEITGDLYAERMFHGPRFQGVISLDRWGEDGTEATMEALPTTELFASTPEVALVTDPVLLDAAGQLVGFWAGEHLTRGFNVFPFAAEDVRLFGPPPAAGTRLTGRVRVRQFSELQMRSDIDILGPDGRLLIQIIGWANRRFDLPPPFDRVWVSPHNARIGGPWAAMTEALGRPAGVDCRRIDHLPRDLMLGSGRIWQRSLAHLVLTGQERSVWHDLPGSELDPHDWLLGRAAAKEAARGVLREHVDLDIYPADVEITSDLPGRFTIDGSWGPRREPGPVVSLSCCDGVAVAIAGDARRCAGVGIHLGRLGQTEGTVDPREQALVDALEVTDRQEWALRLVCAKQATGKALGRGADGGPDLLATDLDAADGIVHVAVGTSSTPGADRGPLAVHTIRDGDWVAAAVIHWKERNDA
ncbi:MAG: beta-ketoacyl synthase N-terminal-like domain-containing protein [Pseudonocardia sp.]